jgi:predicted RNase H-like nuclease (RuvC/YqgF family)
MVQTDISQLSAETSEWRQILRNYREEFSECKKTLLDTCKQNLSKDNLQQVEHFHNQFHIQLINIHDLKQNIKNHERKIQLQTSGIGHSNETFAEHESLLDDFVNLETTLHELRDNFGNFISTTNC